MTLEGALALRGNRPVGAYCPMERALATLTVRSSLLLVREAMYGATRFEEFAARTGLTETTTAARLKELVDAGLFEKRPYQDAGRRRRLEYVPTRAGVDLMTAVIALMQWGNDHDAPPYPPQLRHLDCGEPVEAVLECAAGHRVGPDEMSVSATGPFGRETPQPA